MSVKIAWKQNILVTDFQLLKSLLVVLGFGSQTFVCGFSRQNVCSAARLGILNTLHHWCVLIPLGSQVSCLLWLLSDLWEQYSTDQQTLWNYSSSYQGKMCGHQTQHSKIQQTKISVTKIQLSLLITKYIIYRTGH